MMKLIRKKNHETYTWFSAVVGGGGGGGETYSIIDDLYICLQYYLRFISLVCYTLYLRSTSNEKKFYLKFLIFTDLKVICYYLMLFWLLHEGCKKY